LEKIWRLVVEKNVNATCWTRSLKLCNDESTFSSEFSFFTFHEYGLRICYADVFWNKCL
jgi:hypothetical protein